MKMLKNKHAIPLYFYLLVQLWGRSAYCQTDTLTIGSASVFSGSQVIRVPVFLSNMTSVAGILLKVGYDASVVNPLNVSNGLRAQEQSGLDYHISSTGDLWIVQFDLNGESIEPGTGEILNVDFSLSGSAPQGRSMIELAEAFLSNSDYQSIPVFKKSGYVDILGSTPYPSPQNLSVEVIEGKVYLGWERPISSASQHIKIPSLITLNTIRPEHKQIESSQSLPMHLKKETRMIIDIIEVEPNDSLAQAQTLYGDSPLIIQGSAEVEDSGEMKIRYGDIEYPVIDDIEDLYVVSMASSGLEILLDSFSSDCDLFLISPIADSAEIIDISNSEGSDVPEYIYHPFCEPGTYFIGVSIYDPDPIGTQATNYRLTLTGDFLVTQDSTDVHGYRVYRSNIPNAFQSGTVIGTVPDSITTFIDSPVISTTYYYQITATYPGEESLPSNEVSVSLTQVDQHHPQILPDCIVMDDNFPNPFNTSTMIVYRIDKDCRVTVSVFSMVGEHIVDIVDEKQSVGEYTVTWNGKNAYDIDVASGIYLLRFVVSSSSNRVAQSKKMILIR